MSFRDEYDLPETCPKCDGRSNFMLLPFLLAYIFNCFTCGHEERFFPRTLTGMELVAEGISE